jgi:hypothetical protein
MGVATGGLEKFDFLMIEGTEMIQRPFELPSVEPKSVATIAVVNTDIAAKQLSFPHRRAAMRANAV